MAQGAEGNAARNLVRAHEVVELIELSEACMHPQTASILPLNNFRWARFKTLHNTQLTALQFSNAWSRKRGRIGKGDC